jgi:hypothetical protein
MQRKNLGQVFMCWSHVFEGAVDPKKPGVKARISFE